MTPDAFLDSFIIDLEHAIDSDTTTFEEEL